MTFLLSTPNDQSILSPAQYASSSLFDQLAQSQIPQEEGNHASPLAADFGLDRQLCFPAPELLAQTRSQST
jgi:hypothetical protein